MASTEKSTNNYRGNVDIYMKKPFFVFVLIYMGFDRNRTHVQEIYQRKTRSDPIGNEIRAAAIEK